MEAERVPQQREIVVVEPVEVEPEGLSRGEPAGDGLIGDVGLVRLGSARTAMRRVTARGAPGAPGPG